MGTNGNRELFETYQVGKYEIPMIPSREQGGTEEGESIDPDIRQEGLLGDVFKVDLSGTDFSNFEFPDIVGNNYDDSDVPTDPIDHSFPANEYGYVARQGNNELLREAGQTFRDSGVFYFVPIREGVGTLTINASDSQTNDVEIIAQIWVFDEPENYSTSGPAAATSEADTAPPKLHIYRQQQRLRYLGFTKAPPLPEIDNLNDYVKDTRHPDDPEELALDEIDLDELQVNGVNDYRTNWVRGLFIHAVNNDDETDYDGHDSEADKVRAFSKDRFPVGEEGREFIDAENAPHWVELTVDGLTDPADIPERDTDLPIHIFGESDQLERWATSWSRELLRQAAINWDDHNDNDGSDFILTAATIQQGGPNDFHGTHQAGMDIDINVSGSKENPSHPNRPPFYATHEIGDGQYYIAADPDEEGNERVIVREENVDPPEYHAAVCDPENNSSPPEQLEDGTSVVPIESVGDTIVNDEGLLTDIEDLICSRDGYSLSAVAGKIESFVNAATETGAGVGMIHFNDPRIFNQGDLSGGVSHVEDHAGHFHVDVEPPD